MTRGWVLAAAAIAMVASAAAARGQGIEPEARLDAFIARRGALQAALGADIPLSSAMHLELAAGIGPSFANGRGSDVSARADAIVHFLLDPRHLMRWSPYAGGGIGARYDRGQDWRGVAILVVGVNAPRWKHATPFLEAGFGGGFRVGAGIRRSR